MRSVKKTLSITTEEIRRIVQREIGYHRIAPTIAVLFMTYRCTSRCKMCTIWRRAAESREVDELTFEDWTRVLDMLHDMGVSIIEFFGGDALLRKDVLFPLITYAHKKGFLTELPTNSNLIDGDTATALAESGLDNIWISLDGIGTTHDEIRGRDDTFKRVNRAIEQLNRAKGENDRPRILVNCVVSKINLNTFEQIVPYCQKMGVAAIDFEYVGEIPKESISKTAIDGITPTPFFTSFNSSVLLNKEQAVFLKRKIKEINHQRTEGGPRVNTQKITILSREELVLGRFPNKKCYICRNIVHVDPYGNVLGCLHFNNYHLGNVRKQNLKSIWRNERHKHFIRNQNQKKIDICKFCSNGVQRNYTPLQSLRSLYLEAKGKAGD